MKSLSRGFNVVEECLEYQVMKRPDPLTPDRLVLPGRTALEGMAQDSRALGQLGAPVRNLSPAANERERANERGCAGLTGTGVTESGVRPQWNRFGR